MRRIVMAAFCSLMASAALAQEHKSPASTSSQDALIEQALGAAPPQVRETATVKDLKGNVLRRGAGAYTCFPAPEGIAGPMCMDEQWLAWLDAWMNQKPTTTSAIGIAYMLAGDSPTGGASNVDPAALKPEAHNHWVVEGPHVMVIVPDEKLLAGLPVAPVKDGPYVMWAGTPYAHIMVPVAGRPEQRTASQR